MKEICPQNVVFLHSTSRTHVFEKRNDKLSDKCFYYLIFFNEEAKKAIFEKQNNIILMHIALIAEDQRQDKPNRKRK